MKVVLLPKALSRLDEIFDWIKTTNNENAAARIYNLILDELEILESQPRIAPIEPSLEDFPMQFRSLVIKKKYKAIYYIEELINVVYVATIWDCRQNTEKLTEDIFYS